MSGTTVNSKSQKIIINSAARSISVTNTGPQGPPGINTAIFNVDGGSANDIYDSNLNIDGGGA